MPFRVGSKENDDRFRHGPSEAIQKRQKPLSGKGSKEGGAT